jgi:hypothetical protein
MYLGICINNNDPEKRGRVQVFIPHIMPALYKDWNADGEDIEIHCVGDNIPGGLKTEVVSRLIKILPWAEAASPIVGTSSPGNIVSTVAAAVAGAITEVGNAVAGAVTEVGNAIAGGTTETVEPVGNYLDQSPSAEPSSIKDLNALLTEAGKYAGNDERGAKVRSCYFGNRGGKNCGRGSHGIMAAMTGGGIKGGPLGGNANDFGSKGRMDFTKSGLYQPKVLTPPNYMNDSSQWQLGDVVANGGGGEGFGHIQVWTGKAWVSDFTQNRVLQNNNYKDFALHRPSAAGAARIAQTMGSLGGAEAAGPSKVTEQPSISGDSPSAPVSSKPSPGNLEASPSVPAQAAASAPGAPPAAPPTDPTNYGNAASQDIAPSTAVQTGPVSLVANARNYVTPADLQKYLEYKLESSKLKGYVPHDGAKFGVDGSVKSWSQYFCKLCEKESGFKASLPGPPQDPGGSSGLFQLSTKDGSRYGANPSGRDWTMAQVNDPQLNTDTAIKIHERQVLRKGYICNPGSQKGAGGYFAAASMNKIAKDVAGGKGGSFNSSAIPTGPAPASNDSSTAANQPTGPNGEPRAERQTGQASMSQNTDSHGPVATQNLNGVAKGMFAFPAGGAMLWCFFRDGNPQFPVYFAASYSAAEWGSVYGGGSSPGKPSPGYNPTPEPGQASSTGGMMNLNGVGGLRWEETTNPEDRTQDQKSIMLFGEDGSNMFMGKGLNQFFSKFDRRDQVEGDHWKTILGFEEKWVQGDSNSVVMGDVYVKVGNVSQSARDAVDKINKIVKDIQKPLSESGGGGGGGEGGTPAPTPAPGDVSVTIPENMKVNPNQAIAATGGISITAPTTIQSSSSASTVSTTSNSTPNSSSISTTTTTSTSTTTRSGGGSTTIYADESPAPPPRPPQSRRVTKADFQPGGSRAAVVPSSVKS